MSNRFKLGAALLAAAGTFAFAGAAPANAAACPGGSPSFASLPFPGTFTCQLGGYSITLNSRTGFVDNDSISFSNPSGALRYSIQADNDWLTGTYSINYTITAPTAKLLNTFTNNSTSSDSNADNTWTVVSQTAPKITGVSTMTDGNGVLATSTLTPNLFSETFVATLDVTAGGIESVNFRINTTNAPTPPPAPVPGPLPIFGAAAAFGFSRKVRNRIKAAA
jgi:hypothetical protein